MSPASFAALPSLHGTVSPHEWEARVALAVGHGVLAHYGVDDDIVLLNARTTLSGDRRCSCTAHGC